jgi:hypothetical protein
MQHIPSQFRNRVWSVVIAVTLAACGSSDEVGGNTGGTRGGTGGGGQCPAGPCWEKCTCEGGTPDACLQQCNTTCGNGILDTGELCDGANLNNNTCATATGNTMPNGSLSCSSTCALVTSGCSGGNTGGIGGGGGLGGGGGMGGSFGGGGP